MQVTPAILPHSYDEFLEKIEKVVSVATRVQVDFSDGLVGKAVTWLPDGSERLPHADTIEYECDLMVLNWRETIPKIIAMQFRRIVVHIDSFTDDDIDELVAMVAPYQIPLGLAVLNDVEVGQFKMQISHVRSQYTNIFVQIMGIATIGEQGMFFDESCIERINQVKQTFGDVFLQVDGAMRPETAQKVVRAGADGIVVGSYLLRHDDISAAMSELSCIE
jgi:pentose-5-phosphate-3-epimerase